MQLLGREAMYLRVGPPGAVALLTHQVIQVQGRACVTERRNIYDSTRPAGRHPEFEPPVLRAELKADRGDTSHFRGL